MSDPDHHESRAQRRLRTREELLKAAAAVFARRGYRDASVGEIASEAGYPKAAVSSNFGSKSDLFLAVSEEYAAMRAQELAATQLGLDAEAPLEVRARALADHWMDRLDHDPESFLFMQEFIAEAGRNPKLAHDFALRAAALQYAIARYIDSYLAEEKVELPISSEDLAMIVRALGIGLAVERLIDAEAVRSDLYGDFVELLIRLMRELNDEKKGE